MNNILFILFALMVSLIAGAMLSDALGEIDAENKCIAEHIALGIERRDIKAIDGNCYIKE